MTVDEMLHGLASVMQHALANDDNLSRVINKIERSGYSIAIQLEIGLSIVPKSPVQNFSTALIKTSPKVTRQDINLFKGVIDLEK